MESFNSSSLSRPIHVYLSFKGDEETCRFTDRLWAALETDDLNTFWDGKKLEPGDSIFLPRHFHKAIRQSNISIVVFSKNYASSIWCLEELSEIVARIHEPRYSVFPIFYDIDPSEVQNLSNSFGKAFAEHEQRFPANLRMVHSWRLAIKQVANLSGWAIASDPWPQVIDDIVREIKKKVHQLVCVDADLVGMKSQVREVEELLDLGSNEVRVVGICGMGGIGKTTLARVLYDRISHHFDVCHFLVNVSDEFHMNMRLVSGKNILLVLNGADIYQELQPLIQNIDASLLGLRSRIIVTTRDEGIFKVFKKHDIYRVKLLTRDEALLLFCRKAFRCDSPLRGYDGEVINRALEYANGLPLAIVKLGSFLYNTRASEWSTALVEFKRVASFTVMKVLRRSFFQLGLVAREMFLDIACFFLGKEIKYVEGILGSHVYPIKGGTVGGTVRVLCEDLKEMKLLIGKVALSGHDVKNDIQILIEKSLVTVVDQKIQMHSLLQEMGRKIVLHKFPSNPEEWSRLWDFNDIYGVMQNDTATLKVEAIVLELEDSQRSPLKVEALSRMSNLRLLIFCNVKFFGVLKHLSERLQHISWHQYLFTSLTSSFEPHFLTELILTDSCITNIWDKEKVSNSCITNEWKKGKVFSRLKNMNLSGSKDLIKMPNFRELPYLERLELEGCTKLSQLDPSIADRSKLKFLNLRDCSNLVSIPNDLFSLLSLEMINLACCSKLAYCLKFSPFDLVELDERGSVQQLFPCKRRKLCRQRSI